MVRDHVCTGRCGGAVELNLDVRKGVAGALEAGQHCGPLRHQSGGALHLGLAAGEARIVDQDFGGVEAFQRVELAPVGKGGDAFDDARHGGDIGGLIAGGRRGEGEGGEELGSGHL